MDESAIIGVARPAVVRPGVNVVCLEMVKPTGVLMLVDLLCGHPAVVRPGVNVVCLEMVKATGVLMSVDLLCGHLLQIAVRPTGVRVLLLCGTC